MSVVRLASWSALWHCYHAPKKKHAKAGQMVPESSSKRGKRFPVMLAHTHALPAAAILVAACIGFCLQTWRASPQVTHSSIPACMLQTTSRSGPELQWEVSHRDPHFQAFKTKTDSNGANVHLAVVLGPIQFQFNSCTIISPSTKERPFVCFQEGH